jgi:molybdopterin converting factor small subunit
MPRVRFTGNLARHCPVSDMQAAGSTVREVLAQVCTERPDLRGYILDDQDGLRKHMSIFVDGVQIRDRIRLSDSVTETSVVDIIQALSGG